MNVGGILNLRNLGGGSWRDLYSTGGISAPAYYPAWVLEMVKDTDYPDATGDRFAYPVGEYTGNPYRSLKSGTMNKDLSSTLFTDLILKQDLNFITEGLSVGGKVSLSSYFVNRQQTGSITYPMYILYFNRVGDDPSDVTGQNPWFRQEPAEGATTYKLAPLDLEYQWITGGYYSDPIMNFH